MCSLLFYYYYKLSNICRVRQYVIAAIWSCVTYVNEQTTPLKLCCIIMDLVMNHGVFSLLKFIDVVSH